ncbi:MAG: Rpn family recombination-promoting nuclease/putative transposase [Lachnospiraceae bacterium]|nr:Rpn family recombination-promoting nuclease/putative transposase [Lachnospiraceae bacterium]
MKKKKVKRQVKDRLFRFIFDKDRDALLQLYNALNGTDYTDASKLQVVTIESAVYVVMKNDLAFMVAGVLNLYEHQSTYNPNMPVRFLIYLAQEYQKIIEEAEESLYGTRRISLPTPQCIVFYNGEKEMPEESILRLSDAFENKELEADVELKVRMLNINYGHNSDLVAKCHILEEYARFVEVSRNYATDGENIENVLNNVIDYCIENGILSEFLRKYRAEVVGMLLEEFDVDKYERSLRAEGREEGYEAGHSAGDAQRLVRSVDEIMKRLYLTLPQACKLIGVSVEEYRKARII